MAGMAEADTESAFAWAEDDEPDEPPAPRFTPGRITTVAVSACALVIAAAAGITAWHLRDGEPTRPAAQPPDSTPVSIEPAVPSPSPLPPEALNGVYEIAYDWDKTTVRDNDRTGGGSAKWQFTYAAPKDWISFSTVCTAAECIATGNPLEPDMETPRDVGPLILILMDGNWEDMSPRKEAKPCTDADTGSTIGESLVSQDLALDPRPDGAKLEGTLRTVVDSNACGDAGNTALTPVTATRVKTNKSA